ncbi:hypothetical protein LCGC14_0448790 [marine sediment metagenome]|uniref:Uncharacterized protein n=1 Tax=marine sediment metagenome TaxID=412755 RepID=A0A0F9VSE3_9ZZZZ
MNTEITFSGIPLRTKFRIMWNILRGQTLVINWGGESNEYRD